MSHPPRTPSAREVSQTLTKWGKADVSGRKFALICAACDIMLTIAFAWGLSHCVTHLFVNGGDMGRIGWPVAVMLLSLVGRGGLIYLSQSLNMAHARKVVRHVRRETMKTALAGRYSATANAPRLNALFEDTEALEGYYARFSQAALQGRIAPVLITAIIATQSVVCAAIVAVTLLPFVGFMALLGLGSAAEARRQLDALSRLSNLFADRVRALPVILSFRAGEAQAKSVGRAASEVSERTLRVLRIAFVSSAVLEFFGALSVALIAVYCGFSLLGILPFEVPETLTFTEAFFVLALSPELFAPMRRLSAAYHDKQQATAAAERLMSLEARASLPAQVLEDAPEIVFDEVVYGFDDDENVRLGPVSFTARAGKVTVIRGASGTGKTTLLRLLMGQGRLISGHIFINGEPLGDLTKDIVWAGQTPLILGGSVAENLGADTSPALLRALGLDAVQMARGNAVLNERGSGLSGGERRRIGLARAAAKKAPLLLLDEPTADLDAESAQEVRNALTDMFKGRTVIISTHSDEIAALGDQVVELQP